MTPEARALEVVKKTAYAVTDYNHAGFTITIAHAIRAVILEEREACAQIVDDANPEVECGQIPLNTIYEISEKIRARKT